MQIPSDPDSLVQQAAQLAKAGQRAEARQCLLTALQTDPRHPGALWGLANVTSAVDERRAALINLLNIQPQHTQASDMLARLNVEHPPQIGFEAPTSPPPAVPAPQPQPPMFVEVPEPTRRAVQPPRARMPQQKRSTSPLTLALGAAVAGLIVVVGIAITLMLSGGSDEGDGFLGLGGDEPRTCRALPEEVTSFGDALYNTGRIIYNPLGRVQAEVLANQFESSVPPLMIVRNMDSGAEISRAEAQRSFSCAGDSCHLSQDGQYLIHVDTEYDRDLQSGSASITVYDTRSGALMYQYDRTDVSGSFDIDLSVDRTRLVLRVYERSQDRTTMLEVMDTGSGSVMTRLNMPTEPGEFVTETVFSRDNTMMLLMERNLSEARTAATLYSLPSGTVIRRFSEDIHAAAFSPDSSVLATGHSGHVLRIYDAATGAVRAVREDPLIDRILATGMVNREDLQDEAITELAFSPDGRTLAVGTRMDLYYIWNWETGEQHPVYASNSGYDLLYQDDDTLYLSTRIECTNITGPSAGQIQREAIVGRWSFEPMGTPASIVQIEFTDEMILSLSEANQASDSQPYFWWENFLIVVSPDEVSSGEILRLDDQFLEFSPITDPITLGRMP